MLEENWCITHCNEKIVKIGAENAKIDCFEYESRTTELQVVVPIRQHVNTVNMLCCKWLLQSRKCNIVVLSVETDTYITPASHRTFRIFPFAIPFPSIASPQKFLKGEVNYAQENS